MFSISLQKEQLLCSSIFIANVSNFFNTSRNIYLKQNNKQLSLLYTQTRQVLISTSVGFKNFLKIRGVGYKFNVSPTYLTIEVGYSHLLKKKNSIV